MPPSSSIRSLGFVEMLISVLFGLGVTNLCAGYINEYLMATTVENGIVKSVFVSTIFDVELSRNLGFVAILLMMVRFFHGNMRLVQDSEDPRQVDAARELVAVLLQGVLFSSLGTLLSAEKNLQLVLLGIMGLDLILWFKLRPIFDRRVLLTTLVMAVATLAATKFLKNTPFVEHLGTVVLIAAVVSILGGGVRFHRVSAVDVELSKKAVDNWAAVNFVSLVVLLPAFLGQFKSSSPPGEPPLIYFYVVIVIMSFLDYFLTWNFYFPGLQAKASHKVEES